MNIIIASSYLRSLANSILDVVYPPVCISCGQSLPNGSEKICDSCWNSIERISREHPLYLETKAKLRAAECVGDLVSVFVFAKEGVLQRLAHALKYEGFESIGREIGKKLGLQMKEWGVSADLIIPIPLHRAKQRERGYNQAELIARGISSVTGIPVRTNIVSRIRHTETQTKLSIEGRQKNMEGAFEMVSSRAHEVNRKICLVVDDVITTGATIQACSKELMKAGALRIIAASVALAQ